MTALDNRKKDKAAFSNLQGLWRSNGYGVLLEIDHDGYALYEETKISCIPAFSGSLDELVEHYCDVAASPQGRAFSVRPAAGVTQLRFRRLKAFSRDPDKLGADARFDPAWNFEIFWRTFFEHYALFEIKGVNWRNVYSSCKRKLRDVEDSRQLFYLLSDALRLLCDGHVQLRTPYGHFSAGVPKALHNRLAAELDKAEDSREIASYVSELREWLRDTIRERYLRSNTKHAANRLLEWGRLKEDTGYLAIRAMAGLSGKTGKVHADIHAADRAMSQAMRDLGDCRILIVDMRGNGGGYDSVALRLAGYLTDRKRLAFTKTARKKTGHTGKQPVYVEPVRNERYAGGLILLTSGLTASAAEIFLLALLQHPRATIIGEPTYGILSDAMERHLPNGWTFTLSNELYYAFDGALYEDSGVPPHVEIPHLDRKARARGRDAMLDYVLRTFSE